MKEQNIIFSNSLHEQLSAALAACPHDRLFVLTDTTTLELCWPLVKDMPEMANATMITIGAGDVNKNVESLTHVWKTLSDKGASRRSLMVNLGGGMVTDLGGFAAATFKRGISFINIPTTLLAMVDASVGGKTGINHGGLKNEVGAFAASESVIIDTRFLQTLDYENLASGFAEMIKHGLISNREDWAELMRYDLNNPNLELLAKLLQTSVEVKRRIVEEDPHEHGIRKALNFGHTAGHAIESMAMEEGRPVLHGFAVAWGIVMELYCCAERLGFPHDIMLQTIAFIREHYGVFTFDCNQYEQLYRYITHDKKNASGIINFTLLSDVGAIKINQSLNKDDIFAMFDFYRETMGC